MGEKSDGKVDFQRASKYTGPGGMVGKKDAAAALELLKAQMKLGKYVVKGGPGNDESQKVIDDGKGWVWLAADMTPGGLSLWPRPLTLMACSRRSIGTWPWHASRKRWAGPRSSSAEMVRQDGVQTTMATLALLATRLCAVYTTHACGVMLARLFLRAGLCFDRGLHRLLHAQRSFKRKKK